jgi:hypothetical protein
MTDQATVELDEVPFDEHTDPVTGATAPIVDAVPLDVPEALRRHIDRVAATGTTLDQFVALKKLKADLDKALRQIGGHLEPREHELLTEYATRGTSGEKHSATGATVYINRRIWARVARSGDKATDQEKAATAAALKEAGLGQYVDEAVAVRSLSARFNQIVKAETESRKAAGDLRPVDLAEVLPPGLHGFVDLTEDHILGVRG